MAWQQAWRQAVDDAVSPGTRLTFTRHASPEGDARAAEIALPPGQPRSTAELIAVEARIHAAVERHMPDALGRYGLLFVDLDGFPV